jgi:hypothetical protein
LAETRKRIQQNEERKNNNKDKTTATKNKQHAHCEEIRKNLRRENWGEGKKKRSKETNNRI